MTAPLQASTAFPTSVAPYLKISTATTPAWLADGKIAYLTDITGVPQVWVTDPRFPAPRALTSFTERIGALLAPPTRDRLIFGMDTGGNERQQLWTLDEGGTPRALTADPATIHAFGAFAPDGQQFAFASNARDQRYFDVWTVGLGKPTSEPILVHAADALLTPVAWSPDGRYLLVRRDNTNLDHDLLLLPVDGGAPTLLSPHAGEASFTDATFDPNGDAIYVISNQDRDTAALMRFDLVGGKRLVLAEAEWDVEALAVAPTGDRLAYAVNADGTSRLTLRDLATGAEQPVVGLPNGVVEGLTWSPDGDQVAFSLSGSQDPSSIWACDATGTARQVTTPDLGDLQRTIFVAPHMVRYPTFDGRPIPALWFQPTETPGPWPVIVDVHGGPESQRRVAFAPVTQFLVARGFAVLAPNVRGSTGYGKAYCHLDDVERRMDAVADLAAATDWLNQQPDVDANKIVVMGASYGGFMTLAALTTYPDRWAAGVDIVGIANFITFLEQTGPWRRRTRAAEYGDPERDAELLRAISPLHQAELITAPLLVIHGRNDPRVPLGEAEQLVTKLRSLGRDIELLVFDDEGHGLIKLPNRIAGYGAVTDFLDRVLGAKA